MHWCRLRDFVGPYRCQKLLKAFGKQDLALRRRRPVGDFKTFAELYFLSEDVKWTNLTVLQAGHDQVK